MFTHMKTEKNIQYGESPEDRCEYRAVYSREMGVFIIACGISNPPNTDMLVHQELSKGIIVFLQDGFMTGIEHIEGQKRFHGDLTLRHDQGCIEDIMLIRHLWLDEFYELFSVDEYADQNRNRFQELLYAEEEEIPHGLTYKVIGLSQNRQTVEEFAKAIAVESNPEFRRELIDSLKKYSVGNYDKGEFDAHERVMAVRLLECLGEATAADSAKEFLFKKWGKIGRALYKSSLPMKRPQPERYIKRLVDTSFLSDI